MADDKLVPKHEAALMLSEEEEGVAFWLATSSIPGESLLTAQELADKLNIHRNTVFQMSRRDNVRLRAHQLVKDFVEFERIPKLMQNIWAKAENDPKFALEVLKWVQNWGIDPFLSGDSAIKRGKEAGKHIHLHVPGGLEAAIRTVRSDS